MALYATTLIKEGKSETAMDLYVKHGTPPYQQNYNIYKRIMSDMLKAKDLMKADAYRTWADLRDMLHDLVRWRLQQGISDICLIVNVILFAGISD